MKLQVLFDEPFKCGERAYVGANGKLVHFNPRMHLTDGHICILDRDIEEGCHEVEVPPVRRPCGGCQC